MKSRQRILEMKLDFSCKYLKTIPTIFRPNPRCYVLTVARIVASVILHLNSLHAPLSPQDRLSSSFQMTRGRQTLFQPEHGKAWGECGSQIQKIHGSVEKRVMRQANAPCISYAPSKCAKHIICAKQMRQKDVICSSLWLIAIWKEMAYKRMWPCHLPTSIFLVLPRESTR